MPISFYAVGIITRMIQIFVPDENTRACVGQCSQPLNFCCRALTIAVT